MLAQTLDKMWHKGLCFRERQNANDLPFDFTTVLIHEFLREPFAFATPQQDKGNWIELKEFESKCICGFLNHTAYELPK